MKPVYGRACELSERLGQTEKLVHALRGLWAFDFVASEWESARQLAERTIVAIKETNDGQALMVLTTCWELPILPGRIDLG